MDPEPAQASANGIANVRRGEMCIMLSGDPLVGMTEGLGDDRERHSSEGERRSIGVAQDMKSRRLHPCAGASFPHRSHLVRRAENAAVP